MTWKIKTNEDGAPVITEDGKIIYIDPDQKELPLDPPAMYQKISDLGKENQKHRTKVDELLGTLSVLDGIEDIGEWKKKADEAISTVENFNEKDWLKAEKVEKLKGEITSAYEDKLKNKDKAFAEERNVHAQKIEGLQTQIRKLLISNKFAGSKYFSGTDGSNDKSITLLPSNIGEDHFGKFFKVEEVNGEPVTRAYYSNGDPVISKLNPGEPAEFDEAMGLILDQYPGKNSILRAASGGSGSGGGGGDDDNHGGSDLAKLKQQHAQAMKDGNGKLAITLKNRINALEMKLR